MKDPDNKEKLKKYIYGFGDERPTPQTFLREQSILNGKHLLEYFTDYFVNCCISNSIGTTIPKLKERDVTSCDRQNIRAREVLVREIKVNPRVMT